jgi:hypothetical protein
MKQRYDPRKKTSRKKCRMSEVQKAPRTEETLATIRISTVIQTGNCSKFSHDLPAAINSPINMPQKTQGTTNATTRVVFIFSPYALVYELIS